MNKYASPWIRILAGIIDRLIILTITLCLLYPTVKTVTLNNIFDSWLHLITTVIAISFLMPMAFSYMTAKFGGTIGKLVTGIRVVNNNGKNISFMRAFFRTFAGSAVGGLFMGMGYLYVFFDKNKQGWHDMVSETFVVTKNRAGTFVGILAFIAIIVINTIIVKNIAVAIFESRSIYVEIFEMLQDELNNKSPEVIDSTIYTT